MGHVPPCKRGWRCSGGAAKGAAVRRRCTDAALPGLQARAAQRQRSHERQGQLQGAPVCRTTSTFTPASARRASAWRHDRGRGSSSRRSAHGHGISSMRAHMWGGTVARAGLLAGPANCGTHPTDEVAPPLHARQASAAPAQAQHHGGSIGRPRTWCARNAAICCFSCFSRSFLILAASFSAGPET